MESRKLLTECSNNFQKTVNNVQKTVNKVKKAVNNVQKSVKKTRQQDGTESFNSTERSNWQRVNSNWEVAEENKPNIGWKKNTINQKT